MIQILKSETGEKKSLGGAVKHSKESISFSKVLFRITITVVANLCLGKRFTDSMLIRPSVSTFRVELYVFSCVRLHYDPTPVVFLFCWSAKAS